MFKRFMENKSSLIRMAALVLCAGLALAALAGCSAQEQKKDAADAGKKEFKIGLDASYPPYGFMSDDGKITGFDVDLAAEVAKRNGWSFTPESIDWDAKDAMVDSGSIDCIWNGFTIQGREDKYTFTEPYMVNKQVIVVKADSGIKSEQDLKGKVVMTQSDSAALEVLEGEKKDLAASFKKLEQIPEYNTAFNQLEAGAVDAVACDLSIAQYQMAAKPGKYIMLEPALAEETYGVGFKKGNTEMADIVTKTLKEMYEDGTVAKIAKNYEQYGLNMENWLLK